MSQLSVSVCTHTRSQQLSCGTRGSLRLISQLKTLLDSQGLTLTVNEQVCFGRCEQGVVMRITPEGDFFTRVDENSLQTIIDQLLSVQKNSSN